MKTKLILLSLSAVVAFISCIKRTDNNDPELLQSVSLTLSLGELRMTKSVATFSSDGVAFIDGNITINALDNSSAIISTIYLNLKEASQFEAKANNNYISKPGIIVFPDETTSIQVIGNDDNGSTLTENIKTRQGTITGGAVRVIGAGTIINGKCDVTINPEMARIEVKGKMAASTANKYVSDVKLRAIYLNNTRMTRSADKDATVAAFDRTTPESATASMTPSWTNFMSDPDKATNLSDNFFAFNSGEGLGFGQGFDSNSPTAETHATGYNIFPQTGAFPLSGGSKVEVTVFSPHMIFEFALKQNTSISTVAPSWTDIKTCYLNVVAFTNPDGSFITSFEAGKVYQLDLSEIYPLMNNTFPSPITETPDPLTAGVTLGVTVGSWEVSTVTPII